MWNPRQFPRGSPASVTAWIAMARNIILGLFACSFALAAPSSNEELKPCGGAFYYPSKVTMHSNQIFMLIADMS